MGREIAEAVPEAMAVYDEGSEASGPRPEGAVLRAAGRGARRHRGAAAGARRDEPRDQRGAARARDRARLRRRPLGRRVLGARRGRVAVGRARRSRSCASAASRWPRPRKAAPRLDGGDPRPRRRGRSRRSARRSTTCGRRTTTAPASSSSRARRPSVDEAATRPQREGARRAVRLRVSGAFHSPLVELAAERLRPGDREGRLSRCRRPQFMSTVTAKLEDAQRYRELLVEQLTAPVRFTQAARELIAHGVTTFVEVGPGNVLSGLLKRIDSSVRTISVNDLKSLDAVTQRAWLSAFAPSRASSRSSPAPRAGSAARSPTELARAGRAGRRRLPHRAGGGRGARRGDRRARDPGRRLVGRGREAPRRGGRRRRHARQQRRAHARRAARAHVGRRLARR